MVLHLGKNTVIPVKDIVAIIDAESALKSNDTRMFFELAQKEETVDEVSEGIKSYIITETIKRDNSKKRKIKVKKIYTSNISTITLQKRAGFIEDIE